MARKNGFRTLAAGNRGAVPKNRQGSLDRREDNRDHRNISRSHWGTSLLVGFQVSVRRSRGDPIRRRHRHRHYRAPARRGSAASQRSSESRHTRLAARARSRGRPGGKHSGSQPSLEAFRARKRSATRNDGSEYGRRSELSEGVPKQFRRSFERCPKGIHRHSERAEGRAGKFRDRVSLPCPGSGTLVRHASHPARSARPERR